MGTAVNICNLRTTLLPANQNYPKYNYSQCFPHISWIHETAGFYKDPTSGKDLVIKVRSGIYEANMIALAGDCAAPICGLLQDNAGQINGIVMQRFWALDVSRKTIAEKSNIANTMVKLVQRLRTEKRILHGDIKADSFLILPRGELRICDFGGAAPIADPLGPQQWTPGRLSPYRYVYENSEQAFNEKDDDYALGIAIWEMWCGEIPLNNVSNESMEQYILSGQTIDVSRIEDPRIKKLVQDLMAPAMAMGGHFLNVRRGLWGR